MTLTVDAVYENGVLKPAQPLPLREHETVRVTVHTESGPPGRAYGIAGWTGSVEDLNRLIEDADNDPAEGR
jgi:predicted DNA-binding antitoxin AbrB/MazE fold protein